MKKKSGATQRPNEFHILRFGMYRVVTILTIDDKDESSTHPTSSLDFLSKINYFDRLLRISFRIFFFFFSFENDDDDDDDDEEDLFCFFLY